MKFFSYLLPLILLSCKSQELPLKHSDLSDRKYEQYCTKLKDARVKKDYFNEGLALCNLKQSPKQVYKLMQKAVNKHDTLCYQIHDYQDMHKKGNLTISLIKADTTRWKQLCIACEKIVPLESYYAKKEKDILVYQKKKAIAESKLDTNLFDRKLITLLSEIIKKDQLIRGIPFMDSKNARWKEQKHLDSLNLIEIDNIFRLENGYPKIEKVGYEAISIPWYVLHHQSSVATRKKYLSFLEDAVKKEYISKGMLDGYNERTLTTEEYEKKKK